MSVCISNHEQERLEALKWCGLLDTPPEPTFDRISNLAAKIFRVPFALIVLVDSERLWFKARHGLDAQQSAREGSFCTQVLLGGHAMVVTDALEDARFTDNPFVTGEPHVRFYAGVPLTTSQGQQVGTICVLDTELRPGFGDHEIAILEDLARMAMDEMELRSTTERSQLELDQRKQADKIMRASHDELERRVEQRTADLTRTNAALYEAEAKYRGIFENAIEGIFQTLPDGRLLSANPALARLLGYTDPASMIEAVGHFGSLYVQPGRREEFQRQVTAAGFVIGFESEIRRADGTHIWISENARTICDTEDRLIRYEGSIIDVSSRHAAEQALQKAHEELENRVRERTGELALLNGDLRLLLQERETADATLRRSEARFRAMIENAQDLITILDSRGRMLYQSPSVEYVFGFRPEELVGKNVFEYVHPDDHTLVAERLNAVLVGGQSHVLCEARLLHKDGNWRLIESVGSVAPAGSPIGGLVINSRDITERRRTETLHDARSRQQAAIAELSRHALEGPDLPALFDHAVALASATLGIRAVTVCELLSEDGRMLIRAGCGFAPGIVGQAVVESWRHTRGHAPDHAEPVFIEHFESDPDCRLVVGGDMEQVPIEAVSVLIQAPGRPFGTLCAFSAESRRFSGQDVTFLQTMADLLSTAILRRRNEEALRAVEVRHQRIVANTPGMVFQYLHRADGQVSMVFTSEESRAIYGVEPQAFYEHQSLIWKMAHPDDRERLLQVARDAQSQMQPLGWEGRVVRVSGEIVDVSMRSRPERLANGDTIWDGVVVDVSGLKRAEAAMQAAKEEAERANNAKSEFLSRMSHELRTPLNAILGFGQLLELERLTPAQTASVEQILRGGRHLLDLINEVLDIARIESGQTEFQMESVRVCDLLAEALLLVDPLARARGIRFDSLPPEGGSLHMLADRARLSQVLLNLLSNAIKYNKQNGGVSFQSRRLEGGRVRLAITDTGPGLTPAEVGKLFTPFERLSASRWGVEGTGIGLAISRSLIQGMGGTLGVETEPGRGCTFFIDLPGVLEQSPAASPPTARGTFPVVSPESARRRTVLHIEDQRPNRELVELALATRPQVRLLESVDGESGVMRARLSQPDLILLDLHLPDMDGEEVLRRLRAEPLTAHISVVVLTADATPARRECLRRMGVNIYLTKPLHVAQFLHVLDGAFAQEEA